MKPLKKFWIVFSKELTFIFRDRKTLISSAILTLVITPLLFFVLNVIQESQKQQLEASDIKIAVSESDSIDPFVQALDAQDKITIVATDDLQGSLRRSEVLGYLEVQSDENSGTKRTNYLYVFDERVILSSNSALLIQGISNTYSASVRSQVLNEYGLSEQQINPVSFENKSLQQITGELSQSGMILFLLPYIIILGLVQGSVQYALEMTTGEKERNTLATTLLMNVSSVTIALAKISVTLILSLMMLVLNVASIFIAFRFLPEAAAGVNLTPGLLGQLVLVLLPLSFLMSSLMILLGIYARNQKEGGVFVTPLIIGSVFAGFAANLFDINTPIWVFGIPVLGHVAAIKQVLQDSLTVPNLLVLTFVSIVAFLVIVLITIRMFRREEVLFRQ